MRKNTKSLILVFWAFLIPGSIHAQTPSAMALYSPSSSSLIGDATRIGYHFNNWSTFYMRYNDASYFCSTISDAIWVLNPTIFKIPMPQDFVITDFKILSAYQGFIGSYMGMGMYGWALDYNLMNSDNLFPTFRLPAVEKLTRVALAKLGTAHLKAFAVGDRTYTSRGPQESCILEFCAIGGDVFAPYRYAPLACNSVSGKKETADDVITLSHYVVFATRDTREEHAPLNLRIADTSNALMGSDIDYQWQFSFAADETITSEARLVPIDDKIFVLVYVKYNTTEQTYYLCYHKINILDFLASNNTIISHDIKIGPNNASLIDIVYEPDVKTLVMLLNGDNQSDLYHVDPTVNTSTTATILDYYRGFFYSIDTIGDYFPLCADRYFAMGNRVLFCQDISNGVSIEESCLVKTYIESILQEPLLYEKNRDPIERFSDEKLYRLFRKQVEFFDGSRMCMTPEVPDE